MYRLVGSAAILFGVAATLGACGTYVPEIQEFWGTREDAAIKVNKISAQVVCELRKAVQQVFWDSQNNPVILVPEPGRPPPKVRTLSWFETWAAQVTLNLTIVENSAISPGITFNRPLHNVILHFPTGGDVTAPQSSTLGLGGSLSSTATRVDKLGMFFTVEELKNGKPSMDRSCRTPPANADLFIQSDLKLYEWLKAALLPSATSIVDYTNNKQNTISHEVKFQIVSNGSLTPTWKLVRFTGNTSGTFFSAGRDRTQDLTITFGPQDDQKAKQLAQAAANADLAAQIGAAVAHALKNGQ
jgi:hypothetical protein